MKTLLVGGAVRDLLLGRSVADKDYLLIGCTAKEFIKKNPKAKQVGKTFPIFLLNHEEYAFPRGGTIQDDLSSRDLTINAMAMDEQGELYCHPNALEDLNNKILRPTSCQTFKEDPLRVFRAARFWACLEEFTPHPELIECMSSTEVRKLLPNVLPERVGKEITRAMSGPCPGRFIRLLAQTRCLYPWFQELDEANAIPAGPAKYHKNSILIHTSNVMDRLAGNPLLVWMGLCHDLGKALTPKDILPAHHGHEQRGIRPALDLAERICMPNVCRKAGAIASEAHMNAGRYSELRPGKRVDLLTKLHSAHLTEEVFQLVRADKGQDHWEEASKDLSTILSVKLPPKDQNLGEASGARLRQLRAHALS